MNDYRCPDFVPDYANFKNKKEEMRKKLSNTANHHNYVNKGKGKQEFANLYGRRCAYCGISINVAGIDNFEIDHIIPSSKGGSNDLMNQAFACHKCNRKKREKEIIYEDMIHPDSAEIGRILIRNEDFSISISPEYKKDKNVQSYYDGLGLNNEMRKLDYGLSLLFDLKLHNQIKEECIAQIDALLLRIQYIRNNLC